MDLITAIIGNKERAMPVAILVLGFAVVIGKFKLESVEQDLAQLKADGRKIEKILNENATTWAKIAERVRIYHKD
jgi:cell division protein FtsB